MTNVNPVQETLSVEMPIKKTGSNNGMIIFVAILFLLLGGLGLILVLRSNENIANTLLGKEKVIVSENILTTTPTIIPTQVNADVFTSTDLDINFNIPSGVIIKEVETPYTIDGCVATPLPVNAPKYKAVEAYMNDTKILFLGIYTGCSPLLLEGDGASSGVTTLFEKTVNGVVYKLQKSNDIAGGIMMVPVKFGADSKVGPAKVWNNSAIMMDEDMIAASKGANGTQFSGAMFDASVAIISSINQLH
jgi:hypothetical protein